MDDKQRYKNQCVSPGCRLVGVFDDGKCYRHHHNKPLPVIPTTEKYREDAFRYRKMIGYILSPRTDLDDDFIACESAEDFNRVIDSMPFID